MNTTVGLDIQAGTIAAVELAPRPTELRQAAISSLPPGLVSEGDFIDQAGLSAAVKSFFSEHGLSRRVRLGVANHHVVVRVIELPALDDKEERDSAVRFKASDELPMPLEEAVTDYQVVGRFEDEQRGSFDRVVLVAAPKEMIERMITVVRRAGLKLEGIDLATFALIRALYRPNGSDENAGHGEGKPAEDTVVQDPAPHKQGKASSEPVGKSSESTGDAVGYWHLGGVTSFAIADGADCVFARTIPYGLDAMAQQLAEQSGGSLSDARGWLDWVGLEADPDNLEGDSMMISEARKVLENGAAQLAKELEGSLDYYGSQPQARNVTRTLASGPGASISGLVGAVDEQIQANVQYCEPRFKADHGTAPAQLALAYGLALDEVVA